MLIPREKPYLSGLNSYYLHIDKFIEHLQGEIGSGCLYCKAIDQEVLVYFDEHEIVRGVTQKSGERAQVSQSLEPVMESLTNKNFQVTIYYLDASSIFYWGQMPPFKRAQARLKSTDIPLPDLIFRLSQKKFSGFIDVDLEGRDDCAILFFHNGERRGGSYYWGRGGLSSSDDDYNSLLGLMQNNEAIYDVGHFKTDQVVAPQAESQTEPEQSAKEEEESEFFSNLNGAIDEFIELYINIVSKKIKTDPVIELKLKFIDNLSEYPILDPYNDIFEIDNNGKMQFTDNAPREEISAALIHCAWKVIEDVKMVKKFKQTINKWPYRAALEERGIKVIR